MGYPRRAHPGRARYIAANPVLGRRGPPVWKTARTVVTGTVRDLLGSWRSLALTDMAYKLLAFALLTPATSLLLRWMRSDTTFRVVADTDILRFLDASSHYTPSVGCCSKRLESASGTLILKPLRRPQRTCTAWSSPRFTRCNTVCRETPRIRMASTIGT